MSGERDIQQLKDVVVFAAKLAEGVHEALADGKIGLSDASILFGLIQPGLEAISGAGEIPSEVADLQPEELTELVSAVMAELAFADDKARRVVAAALDLMGVSVPKVQALVAAIKS